MKYLNGTDLQLYITGTTQKGEKAPQWNCDSSSMHDLYEELEEFKCNYPDVVHIEIHIALPIVGYSAQERLARPIALDLEENLRCE